MTAALAWGAPALAVLLAASCKSPADTPDAGGDASTWTQRVAVGKDWIDCVGVLHVANVRGVSAGNIRRVGKGDPTLRTVSRIADLSPTDLAAFCDWEACARANGYAHACHVDDAGAERCHVCDAGGGCEGFPMSRAECVAHAADPGRAECHVGLLEECLVQRAVRGAGYPTTTRTCQESAAACAGTLPGDLTALALAAQHETDQVTVQEARRYLTVSDPRISPNGSEASALKALDAWEGGLPSDAVDAGSADAAPDDGGDGGD